MGSWQIASANFDTPLRDGRWGPPLVLSGPPGTAKTSKAKQMARRKRAGCEVLIPATMESTDFGGQPYLNEKVVYNAEGKVVGKSKELALAPGAWGRRARAAGRCLVVLDEGNSANQSVFAAECRTILDNMLGDFDLGPGIRWMMLMNPIEISAEIGGQELPPAIANRCGHLSVDAPDWSEWVEWISLGEKEGYDEGDDGDADERERKILEVWPEAYEKATTEVVTFLAAKRDRWAPGMPTGNARHGAWASPRSWEMAMRARASARIHGLNAEDTLRYQAAFVGHEPIKELHTFLKAQDLPDPKAWLAKQVEFTPSDDRPDRTQAFLVSVGLTLANLQKGKRVKELERFMLFAKTLDGRRDAVVRSFYTFSKTIDHPEIMALPRQLEAYFNEVASIAGKADVANARRGA